MYFFRVVAATAVAAETRWRKSGIDISIRDVFLAWFRRRIAEERDRMERDRAGEQVAHEIDSAEIRKIMFDSFQNEVSYFNYTSISYLIAFNV